VLRSSEQMSGFGAGTISLSAQRSSNSWALNRHCSLDLNTMFFGSAVVINTPRNVRIMAEDPFGRNMPEWKCRQL